MWESLSPGFHSSFSDPTKASRASNFGRWVHSPIDQCLCRGNKETLPGLVASAQHLIIFSSEHRLPLPSRCERALLTPPLSHTLFTDMDSKCGVANAVQTKPSPNTPRISCPGPHGCERQNLPDTASLTAIPKRRKTQPRQDGWSRNYSKVHTHSPPKTPPKQAGAPRDAWMSELLAFSFFLPQPFPCLALKLPGHLNVTYRFDYWLSGPMFKTYPLFLEILDLAGGPSQPWSSRDP